MSRTGIAGGTAEEGDELDEAPGAKVGEGNRTVL